MTSLHFWHLCSLHWLFSIILTNVRNFFICFRLFLFVSVDFTILQMKIYCFLESFQYLLFIHFQFLMETCTGMIFCKMEFFYALFPNPWRVRGFRFRFSRKIKGKTVKYTWENYTKFLPVKSKLCMKILVSRPSFDTTWQIFRYCA